MSPSKGKGKDGHDSLRDRLSGPSDQKAGLGKRDPEEVKQIIYEASKGSKYFLNEQRKDEELTLKVDKLVAEVEALVAARGGDLKQEERCVDDMIRELEKTRDLSQVVVVVDADAFYASCHELVDPSLKGTAFAVGKGVLTTASYAAREYGCRSAQAGYIAIKLCPHLKFVSLDGALYSKMSKQIMKILAQYGTISPASLDEAYCSLTEYCHKHSVTPEVAAQRMRDQVKRETSLTVSAGISANAMLSKIAADLRKPDGQFSVPRTREGIINFTKDLPIRRIPGIGRVSERWLTGLGVHTVGDIYRMRGKLFLVKNKIGLTFLLRAYLGLGRTTIQPAKRGSRKAVGCEETFHPIDNVDLLHEQLRKIAETLEGDLRRTDYSGRTVTLKLKHDTYEVISRAYTAGKAVFVSDAKTLYAIGKRLLDNEIAEFARTQQKKKGQKPVSGPGEPKKPLRLRLMGLRVSNLRDERDGNLNKWAVKPGSVLSENEERKAAEMIQLDSDGEIDETALEEVLSSPRQVTSKPPSPKRSPSSTSVSSPFPGEGRRLSDSDRPGALAPFSSSDALWAAVGDLPSDEELAFGRFEDDSDHGDADEDLVDEEDDGAVGPDDRMKPFWTAGESKNSKKELAFNPAPERNRLAFHQTGESSTSNSRTSSSQMLTCPVCDKQFVATETSMAHHVDAHFAEAKLKQPKAESSAPGPPKKRKGQASSSSSSKKPKSEPQGKNRASLQSYWGK